MQPIERGRESTVGPGGPRDFPSTCWSRFLGGFQGDASLRQRALEELALLYWKPIYAYLRARWAKTVEDARDLTQDFFVWLIESPFLGRADPSRGRFRAFVKAALADYLSNHERDRRALKRGGGKAFLSLDAAPAGTLPDPEGKTPEEALDEEWRDGLLSRAERALEAQLRREGREKQFLLFRDYYLSNVEEADYRELARRHGVDESAVGGLLRQSRDRFRAIVTDLVAETVEGPEELRLELKTLFGEEHS